MIWAEALIEGHWTNLVGSTISAGFAVLTAWYLLTKAIPKMQEAFENALAAQRKDFTDSLGQHENKFDTRDTERRTEGKDALKAILDHCKEESVRRDEVFKHEMELVYKGLGDVGEGLEKVRDALREFRNPPYPR